MQLTSDIGMNYVSAVYGVVVFVIAIDYFIRGKREYRGQSSRHEDATGMLRAGSVDLGGERDGKPHLSHIS